MEKINIFKAFSTKNGRFILNPGTRTKITRFRVIPGLQHKSFITSHRKFGNNLS